jgi:5-methylcytosine-specific restriction endonuclease McrA
MQRVLVLDKNRKPLMPCHPARARELLKKGRAAVFRRQPFTIILKDREGGETQPLTLKIDPGSKTTGMALVGHFRRGPRVVWAAEITHRGSLIRQRLWARRQVRRSRRSRKTRYRKPRFDNRRRKEGWLPPSLRSRVENIATWVSRLRRWCPLTTLALEWAKFDPQKLQNPEISGVEYQQGELFGYEVREYLLEKWNRRCAYCGAENVPLYVEHLTPVCRGGSNRVRNLTLACLKCNLAKGNRTAEEFGYPHLQEQARQPLRDVAAINATRGAIYRRLQPLGLPIEGGSGGQTKYNRTVQGYPKAHWIDAACVGESGQPVFLHPEQNYLTIQATGWGCRQMCRTDRHGFPIIHKARVKRRQSWQTGDLARAVIPRGKYVGRYPLGRVVAKSGSFLFSLPGRRGKDRIPVHPKHLTRIQHNDGYQYE